MQKLYRPFAAATVLLLAQGCASTGGEGGTDGRSDEGRDVITAAEIEKSGARTAWDALRRVGRISMSETSRGEPSSMKLRGSRSLVLDDTPLVVLDGVAIRDVRVLETIRAESVQWMEILDAADGTLMHGPMAGGGAIVVHTKDGRGGDRAGPQ